MSKSSFSQSGYPKLIVYQGDTLIALTTHQAKVVNLMKVEHDRYKDLVNNLQTQSKQQDVIIVKKDTLINILQGQDKQYQAIINNNTALEVMLNKDITDRDKQIKKLKLKSGILGTVATGLAVLVAYLSLK